MSYQAYLLRYYPTDTQVMGELFVYNKMELVISAKTLERPELDNKRNQSCIPDGNYDVIKHYSKKFGHCFWVVNVSERSEILIHAGNFVENTKGCILVGNGFLDINFDGIMDLTDSRKTLDLLYELLPEAFNLKIYW